MVFQLKYFIKLTKQNVVVKNTLKRRVERSHLCYGCNFFKSANNGEYRLGATLLDLKIF